jgi:hypothetical protein
MSVRVFAVQQPAYYDHTQRRFIPKYDLEPAKEFGSLVLLLPPGNVFKDRIPQMVADLNTKLATFSADDYLLAIGDPIALAAASLIAARHTGGVLRLLKWDRISSVYTPFTVEAC